MNYGPINQDKPNIYSTFRKREGTECPPVPLSHAHTGPSQYRIDSVTQKTQGQVPWRAVVPNLSGFANWLGWGGGGEESVPSEWQVWMCALLHGGPLCVKLTSIVCTNGASRVRGSARRLHKWRCAQHTHLPLEQPDCKIHKKIVEKIYLCEDNNNLIA